MKTRARIAATGSRKALEQWEKGWQGLWSKASRSAYELPAGDDREREFLAETRTPEK